MVEHHNIVLLMSNPIRFNLCGFLQSSYYRETTAEEVIVEAKKARLDLPSIERN